MFASNGSHQFRDEDGQVVMKLPAFNEPIGFLHYTPQDISRGLSARGSHDREQARFTKFSPAGLVASSKPSE